MTKKAILYARVSTDEQAERGYSLGTQLSAMRDYARRQGFDIAEAFKEHYTGTTLERPELDKARALLAAGEADAIIVHASDRLTRDLGDLRFLRDDWQSLGIELHYVNRGKAEKYARKPHD
jgi:site-specific DNA recombinase